jgi:hypothetical protein
VLADRQMLIVEHDVAGAAIDRAPTLAMSRLVFEAENPAALSREFDQKSLLMRAAIFDRRQLSGVPRRAGAQLRSASDLVDENPRPTSIRHRARQRG